MKLRPQRMVATLLGVVLWWALTPALAQTVPPASGLDPEKVLLELHNPERPQEKQQVHFVNEAAMDDFVHNSSNYLALFSGAFGPSVVVPRFAVGVQVDREGVVTDVVNPSREGQVPVWEKNPVPLPIPEGGFVVVGADTGYLRNNFKKFLATRFVKGSRAALLVNGLPATVAQVAGRTVRPILQLRGGQVFSTTEKTITLGGKVVPYLPEQVTGEPAGTQTPRVHFQGKPLTVTPDGSFAVEASLQPGLNELTFTLLRADRTLVRSQLVRRVTPVSQSTQPVVLWMEQYTSMRLRSHQDILAYLQQARRSGINAIALDVKGYEGFVSYLKNDLTGRPHVSSMVGQARQGANPNLDLLGEMVRIGHQLGMKVYASINTFGEGSMRESALIHQYPDWEEQIYHPADGGAILPVRQSKAPSRVVLFVNPVHPLARQMQLKTIEEIIKNYDVDGIILDRTRYDGNFADFSPLSRQAFEGHLRQRGKVLSRWPDDVFRWVQQPDGTFVHQEGPLYFDWWTFRAGVVGSFTREARQLIDRYKLGGRKLQLGQYVGGQYDTLYEVGNNWASPEFRYDPRLQLVNGRIYTEEYSRTGHLLDLDFVMLGTYQNDPFSVQQDLTIAAIVSQDRVPLYGGVGLQGAADPEVLRDLLQVHRTYSSGIMLFEYSTADLGEIRAALQNQISTQQTFTGVSTPLHVPLQVHSVDTARKDNQLVLYTPRFGPSTRTARFGVEVEVGPDGKVVSGKNLEQARNWNFNTPQDNNSMIPAGGFVLSAMDLSGNKTLRQQLARAFNIGDDVRAAQLHIEGIKAGQVTDEEQVMLQGEVQVFGVGTPELRINGSGVWLKDGKFLQPVPLQMGSNVIQLQLRVDGYPVIEKVWQVTRTEP